MTAIIDDHKAIKVAMEELKRPERPTEAPAETYTVASLTDCFVATSGTLQLAEISPAKLFQQEAEAAVADALFGDCA
jgi:predicted HAD superfamily Cof-like phosphohydrolase